MKKFHFKEDTKEKILNTFEWLLVGIFMQGLITFWYSTVDLNDYSLIHELELDKEGLSLAEYFKEIYEKPFLLIRFLNIFSCKEAVYFYILLYTLWKIRNEWFGNPFAIKKANSNSWNTKKIKISNYESKKINLTKSKKQFEIYSDKNQNKDPFNNFTDLDWDTRKNRI